MIINVLLYLRNNRQGNYREQNEDCILIDHEVINSGSYESTVAAPFIAAVCDGVGGENAGEVASSFV